MIGIVDYFAGNLRSVETALRRIGADFFVSGRPEELLRADRLIFPGDGEASSAMRYLRERGLDSMLCAYVRRGNPVLGICLGCQIILSWSEEGDTPCLGILDGTCRLLPRGTGLKVPHMGWNSMEYTSRHPLLEGIASGSVFYFVHSYYPEPGAEAVPIGWTEYGTRFPSGFGRGNLAAFQFHPEKSGEAGLQLLANFVKWDPMREAP